MATSFTVQRSTSGDITILALNGFLDAATSSVTTDSGFSRDDMLALGNRLRSVNASDILFFTVPIAKSIQDDYIVCLEDGKRLKMLKRYLRSKYNLSPDEYRRKWGLSSDYPMVAPAYANRRSEFAKQIGLGRGVRRQKA